MICCCKKIQKKTKKEAVAADYLIFSPMGLSEQISEYLLTKLTKKSPRGSKSCGGFDVSAEKLTLTPAHRDTDHSPF